MNQQPAEATSVTEPSVKSGMGYPNHREEESPTPIGWQGLDQTDLRIVSRETSGSN
jgi:hypothetical protein